MLYFVEWGKVSHLNPELLDSSNLTGLLTPGIPCLCFPSTGIKGQPSHLHGLYMGNSTHIQLHKLLYSKSFAHWTISLPPHPHQGKLQKLMIEKPMNWKISQTVKEDLVPVPKLPHAIKNPQTVFSLLCLIPLSVFYSTRLGSGTVSVYACLDLKVTRNFVLFWHLPLCGFPLQLEYGFFALFYWHFYCKISWERPFRVMCAWGLICFLCPSVEFLLWLHWVRSSGPLLSPSALFLCRGFPGWSLSCVSARIKSVGKLIFFILTLWCNPVSGMSSTFEDIFACFSWYLPLSFPLRHWAFHSLHLLLF